MDSENTTKTTQFKTSIFPDNEIEHIEKDQYKMSSLLGVVPILIVAFFVLKSFIYIKDQKRHGK